MRNTQFDVINKHDRYLSIYRKRDNLLRMLTRLSAELYIGYNNELE